MGTAEELGGLRRKPSSGADRICSASEFQKDNKSEAFVPEQRHAAMGLKQSPKIAAPLGSIDIEQELMPGEIRFGSFAIVRIDILADFKCLVALSVG